MIRRIAVGIGAAMALLFCVILLPGDGSLSSQAVGSSYTLKLPTQDEIKAKYKEYAIDISSSVTYSTACSTSAPYAMGDLSAKDKQNGLNAINFCRYVAGLPADIELNTTYCQYAQASSLVNAVNGVLSHYPNKPSGMSEDLYKMGYTGSSSSNIAMGFRNIADSVIRGYMNDSDNSNISVLGHRRWILSPDWKYTGVGQVGSYSATYVFDWSRSETFSGDYIAWPPANMPMELYIGSGSNYAFSVILSDKYDTPSASKVTVTVQSAKQNRTWNLNSSSTSYSQYLNVSSEYIGSLYNCIIFNVGKFEANDKVTVTINGITKNGVSAPITYTVNFFEIEHKYEARETKSATCTTEGVMTYTCSVCGDSYTKPIAKTSHNYSSEWTTDKAATCIAEGSKSHHCIYCGDKKDITAIPKTDHTYSSKVTKAATCTDTGTETLTCTVCSASKTQSIPAKGHSFGAYKITVQPTTEKEGTEVRTCSSCGTTEKRTVPKLTDTGMGTTASSGSEPADDPSVTTGGGTEAPSGGGDDPAPSESGGEGSSPSDGAEEGSSPSTDGEGNPMTTTTPPDAPADDDPSGGSEEQTGEPPAGGISDTANGTGGGLPAIAVVGIAAGALAVVGGGAFVFFRFIKK